MPFNSIYEIKTNSKPYNFSEFLYALLLFENPISIEKVNRLLLEFNEKSEKRSQGVNGEVLLLPFDYVELNDVEYKLSSGASLEDEVTEGISLFKLLFFKTKPIIYDFIYEKYFGAQSKKVSPYGNMMRDIKSSDKARQKPILNDSLFRDYKCKKEIDLIRLAFYEVFGKDLKVIGAATKGSAYNYLDLIENYYRFIPSSPISGLLTNDSEICISFSDDKYSNEKYTSFMYRDIFMNDQNFSESYIRFCQLANKNIGGGELNLVERNSRHDINIRHIEYALRDNYYGPQQGEFELLSSTNCNRFIQYLASRTRFGDERLGYIYYFDENLLKQYLTDQEYKIAIECIEERNPIYKRDYKQHYSEDLPDINIGPNISYIRKR